MKTIREFLNTIREDEEIKKLLSESEELKKEYKTRPRFGQFKKKTKESIALRHFWESLNGARLRLLIEEKYHVNTDHSLLTGKLKDALLLHLTERERSGI